MQISIKTSPVPKRLVIRNKVAIVTHLPDHFADPLDIEVNSTPLHDTIHPTKGDTITAYPSIMRQMARVQSAAAYGWTVRPFMLWVNRRFDGDPLGSKFGEAGVDRYPKAECITGYGNFVEIVNTVGDYYQINATKNTIDWDQLDASFNWYNYPHLWVKQSARNKATPPKIFNVGSGYDAYFPLLQAKAGLWIFKKDVEVLPPSPDGGYVLQGMSVYTAGMKPLRLARKPGELIYPLDGWKMRTAGVIPAKEIL